MSELTGKVDRRLLAQQCRRLAEVQAYLTTGDVFPTAEDWPDAIEGILNLLAAEYPETPAATEQPAKLQVWIVYVEENRNTEPEIVGVYRTEALAGEARQRRVAEAQQHGSIVWGEDAVDADIDWDVDVHCEAFELDG